jgi:hypothetical protein
MDLERIYAALEHGRYQRLDSAGLPGCFTYLALTLFVDSLIEDGLVTLGAFRSKLSGFLDVDRSFSNLTGIAEMWRELKSWLDEKAAKGEPFRRLLLPDPGSMTHIGYTARLSFPSRRDKRVMETFLEENPKLVASPTAFLGKFRTVAADPRISWGLAQAFEEFHNEFLSGHRALAGHRFWALVQAISHGQKISAPHVDLSMEITRDEDEAWIFSLHTSGNNGTERDTFETLDLAASKAISLAPHDLAATLGKGFIVFRQTGNALWRAASGISECVGRVIVGLAPQVADRLGGGLGKLVATGTWFLTEQPVLISAVEKAVRRLGGPNSEEDHIVSISVFEGVRSGRYWLGRPSFLPRISADGSALVARAEERATGEVRCIEMEKAPGIFRLVADRSPEGTFVVEPAEGLGDSRFWSRRLTFVADALIHQTLSEGPPADPMVEWEDTQRSELTVKDFEPTYCESVSELDDLVEAVYAGGRSGWSEEDIIRLIRRGLTTQVNPWDVLRSLQESTLLKPMLRAQWRGRFWLLEPPSLAKLSGPQGPIVVVQGCLGARLVDEFRRTVTGSGGTIFRRSGVTQLAPTLLGCVGADIAFLSAKLGWPISAIALPGEKKLAFSLTSRRPDRYLLAHRWCWEKGRFVSQQYAAAAPVVLSRWCHPTARDHDIYVVSIEDQSWHLLSRSAAIALAHSVAGIPLFRASEGLLCRSGREGALPDAFAAESRIRHLANPGPNKDGYFYGFPAMALVRLTSAIPNLVQGLQDSAGTRNSDAVSLAVHSGGRVRPTWKKGALSTTHSS